MSSAAIALIEVLHLRRPDDRDRHTRLPQEPCQRNLRRGHSPLACDASGALGHGDVGL
jgi:hypothetical protein